MLENILKSIAPQNVEPQKLQQAACLLLPFIEGYCLTHKNLPVESDVLAKQLGILIFNMVSH